MYCHFFLFVSIYLDKRQTVDTIFNCIQLYSILLCEVIRNQITFRIMFDRKELLIIMMTYVLQSYLQHNLSLSLAVMQIATCKLNYWTGIKHERRLGQHYKFLSTNRYLKVRSSLRIYWEACFLILWCLYQVQIFNSPCRDNYPNL